MAGKRRVVHSRKGEAVVIQDVPIATLHGADWNPKEITDDRLDSLKRAITEDPDFMWERPVLAMADGTVYAGNQRLLACTELGWETIPSIMEDVPEALARERTLRDNQSWGEWNDESLAQLLADQSGPPINNGSLGFTDDELARIMRNLPQPAVPPEPATAEGGTIIAHQEGERGRTPQEMAENWQVGATRQLVLYYHNDEYDRVSGILADLREEMKTETNADVVKAAVEWGHAHYCAEGEAAEPG